MLELVFQTTVFGPLRFEFDRPIIRVGSGPNNDLVLRHASVSPHHCLLVFQGEQVFWLPPDQILPLQADWERLAGPGLGVGAEMRIGDLRFTLQYSSRTVAIPETRQPGAGGSDWNSLTGAEAEGAPPRYFCERCLVFVPDAEVKHIGLVGHAKRYLCPKCSGLLQVEPEPPPPPKGIKEHLRRAAWSLSAASRKRR